jgi:predicted DCC family thiol-disulfide oxidoreductase YuxK
VSAALPVLLFDGDCAFCTSCVNWMHRHIRRLDTTVPYQRADLDSLGLTAAQCEVALQWVGVDRTVLSAHRAVAQVLIDAGKGWGVVGRAMRLPGIRTLTAVTYRGVARNRHRLPGGTPACSLDAHRSPDSR